MTPDRIRRLTACRQAAEALRRAGETHAPRSRLAGVVGCDPLLLRDDLAAAGVRGRPRIGLDLAQLLVAVDRALGAGGRPDEAVLVGAGHLGTALLGHPGFAALGLRIVAAFDTDARRIGTEVHGRPVLPLSRLDDVVRRLGVRLGILALPPFSAANAARVLYDAGVRGILNLTGQDLRLPADAVVQDLDLGAGLAAFVDRLGIPPNPGADKPPRPADQ